MAYVELDSVSSVSTDFPNIPDGVYRVRIDNSKSIPVKEGPNKGKPQIEWVFTIVEPATMTDPLSKEEIPTAGRKLWRNTPTWEGAQGFLKDLIAATNVKVARGFDTNDLHGEEILVLVGTKMLGGKPRNEILHYEKVPGGWRENPTAAAPATEDDLPF